MSQSKLFRTVLAGCLVCVLSLGFMPGVSSAAKTLKYSDHDPTGGLRTDFYRNVLLPEITKQTEGRIKFQDFWGGALLSATEVLDGVGDGVADMGMIYADFYPKRLMLHQGFKVFMEGPGDYDVMVNLYADVYKEIPEFLAELNRFNQRPLYTSPGLPLAFMSVKPLPDLDALKGNKWRASSRWHQMFLKHAGATAVFIPWAEVYMSLQTGALDGNLANYDGMHMTKQDEVAPNILVARELWNATPFLVTINNDTWSGLSKEDQAGIMKAVEICTVRFGKEVYNQGIEDIFAAQKKAGQNPRYLTSDEVAAWAKKCAEVGAPGIWLNDLKEAKVKNAEAAVKKFIEMHQSATAESRKLSAAQK